MKFNDMILKIAISPNILPNSFKVYRNVPYQVTHGPMAHNGPMAPIPRQPPASTQPGP